MNRVLSIAIISLTMSVVTGHAGVVDDFSEGGWNRSTSTPGKVSMDTGKLHLEDGRDPPDWITVSKTFYIDVDKMPFFVVKVTSASDRGTVKLIRKEPYDKRVAIEIDRPGLYSVDMRSRFGWKGLAAIETCLYAIGNEEEITYEYVKFAEGLTQQEKVLIANQTAGGNVRLNIAPFEIVPLFNTCSFYFKSRARDGLSVDYRRKGGSWWRAHAPVYVKEDGMYRGSIVDLDEEMLYELRITAKNGDVMAQQEFHTWSSRVPVGKTIILDNKTFTGQLNVRESGSADAWVKITAKKGFVLRNDRRGPLIELYKAKYVILEGLTLHGGLKEAISIRRCENVRVVNCDISGWGRIG